MKNLKFIKWLCTYTYEKQSPQRLGRYAAMLIMLLTLGVGNAWAGYGWSAKGWNPDGHGVRFWRVPVGGVGANYDKSVTSTGYNNTYNEDYNNMGEVSHLEFKHFWAKMYQGGDDNSFDGNSGDIYYNVHLRDESAGSFTCQHQCAWVWGSYGGDGYRYPQFYCTDGDGLQINLLSSRGSGIYTFEFYFYCYYQNYGGETYMNNGGSSNNYKMYFTIPVPASVNDYSITPSNRVSGSGSENDPYIITWGTTMRLSVSGSQSTADANSSLYTKFGSDSYAAATYKDITPTTSKQSITVKSKYYNSAYDLSGTETATQTIWYQWEDPYTITVQTNGVGTGAVSPSTVYTKGNVASASFTASVPVADAAKYEFVNWTATSGVTLQTDATSSTNTVKATGNGTVTANFRSRSYTVTYKDKDNEDYSGSNGASLTTSYTYGTGIAELTDGVKSGYTFGGWYTASDCSLGSTTSIGNSETGNKTFYAKWNANITLDKNGGSADGSATTIYKSDAKLDISAPTHATGYYILGYYKESACETLVAAPDGTLESAVSGLTDENGKWVATEDKTLYTKWSNEYTVTLDDDDATIHGTANVTATYGSAMPSITIPRKTGYLFGGYFEDLGDPSSKYYDENGVSAHVWDIIDHDATLYAKWNGISYTVSFDPNGGTGTMADQNKIYGTSTQLSANTFTRDGYYFLGWNTEPDGAGTKYKDEKYVSTMTTSQGAIVTLYAQWAKTHTLYFLNMGVSGWKNEDYGEGSAGTTRYAYAYISYDGDVKYPLGTYDTGTRQGTQMTAVSDITLTNVNSGQVTWCWKIEGVPEGSTIIFSDNTDDHKSSNQSGWSADKPYFCNGNSTWYAVDENDATRISAMTEMSVYIGAGDFGSWKFYALDKHGDDSYAIIWLNTDQTYQYQYYNWRTGSYSGATAESAYIINGGGSVDVYGPWDLNGNKDVMLKTNTHASGEYKFMLDWAGGAPQTTIRVPRGVNLTTTSPTEAKKGESVTVSFTADAWTNLSSGTDKSSLTYYFEFSTDNSNWTTIATVGPVSDQLQANASYTFNAQSGYFRVKLVNANGVASYSGSTAFTAYTIKSFYVYNPWYNENWSTLHLYTWNDAGSKPTYNGSFPGHNSGNCEHGNAIENKGNGWYYITIDERADNFQLVGNETYNDHKTEDCSVSNYIQDAKYMIKTVSSINKVIEYEAKGSSDFRLKYTYGTPTKTLYSPIYNTTLDGTTITTSMWMNAKQTSTLEIEQGNGDNSWVSTGVTYSSTTDGIGGLIDSEHRDHGYVFTMKLNTSTLSVSDVEEYTGSFYVRTDGLDGGWNKYQKADHMMNNSKASLDGTPTYDYYLCKWVGTPGTNVKFTVANDYNRELVASLEGDATEGDPLYGRQTIPDATNVRFAWNSQTNTLTRAYLSGASAASSRFLVLVETTDPKGKIYDASGNPLTTGNGRVDGLNEHELLFEDNGNWVYQLDMMANPGAQAKVTAKYNGEEPEFIPTTTLIGGDGSSKYSYRIVYDFKTNILTNAWVADGSQINENIVLNSNVMIIRVGQGNAVQLTFGENKSMSEVEKVYGVMQFNRSTINDESISRYKRDLYWISFPFNVELKDAFGMGEYGTHWIIEYYDGQGRAAHGFWADSEPNWKFVTPAMRDNYTLKANEGYILALDLDELGSTSPVWENGVNETFLYFPSKDNIGNIQATTAKVDLGNPADYQCIINRGTAEGDRRIKDSYWHCIGVPSYADASSSNITSDGVSTTIVWQVENGSLPFLYQWQGYTTGENTLEVVSTSGGSSFTFQPMYSYLVQYNQQYMYWSAVTNQASVAARVNETPDKEYKLVLSIGEEEQDKAMLRLTDKEGVTNRFEFNQDLSKEYNAGRGNIWTVTADTVEVAGNSMPKPVQTTLVPVGVKVVANGEYTLSMPEGTNGEDVYLIDNAYGTRTNLGLMPYTVTLTAGTYEGRFVLEFAPIQDSPTSLENDGLSRSDELNDANDDVRKVFVGGRIYIIRDGKVYDAAGQRVE